MEWLSWHSEEGPTVGEAARHLHSRWLTEALASRREYPRIPVRRVEHGGFSGLLGRANGRNLAGQWWERALDRID